MDRTTIDRKSIAFVIMKKNAVIDHSFFLSFNTEILRIWNSEIN